MDQEHHFKGRRLVEHLLAGHSEQGPDLGVGGPAGGGEAGEGGGRPGEAAGEAGGDRRAGQGLGQAGGFVSLFIFVLLFQTVFYICICVYASGFWTQVEELRHQGRGIQRQLDNQAAE